MTLKNILQEVEKEFIERSYQGLAYLADPAIEDWEKACRGHAKIMFDSVVKTQITTAINQAMKEVIPEKENKGGFIGDSTEFNRAITEIEQNIIKFYQ